MNRRQAGTSVLLTVFAAGIVAAVLWFDSVYLGLSPLHENTYPNSTPVYLARTFAFAAAAAIAFFALLRLPDRGRLPADSEPTQWARLTIVLGAVVTLATVALFLLSPQGYHLLSLEDNVVEMLSALLALEASLVLITVAVIVLRRHGRAELLRAALLACLGLACLIVGVEEVSWGQRYLDLETPDAILELSERNEINFHNMNTAFFEFAYYFGLFLFFVAAPIVHARTNLFARLGPTGDFVPTWTSALVVAPAFGYNYVFWNLAFTQIAFWFTAFFLAWHIRNLIREQAWATTVAAGASALAFLAAQYVFYFQGEMFLAIRLWDATEYKELILPYALLVYSIVLAHRFRGSGGLASVFERTSSAEGPAEPVRAEVDPALPHAA
ncbi:MAG: hypothetical protein GKS06_15615 [Acidobacteria bacterium]|nr:hypothetical protein [Acidobacteriota bacterium]